jgi:ribonuclease HI
MIILIDGAYSDVYKIGGIGIYIKNKKKEEKITIPCFECNSSLDAEKKALEHIYMILNVKKIKKNVTILTDSLELVKDINIIKNLNKFYEVEYKVGWHNREFNKEADNLAKKAKNKILKEQEEEVKSLIYNNNQIEEIKIKKRNLLLNLSEKTINEKKELLRLLATNENEIMIYSHFFNKININKINQDIYTYILDKVIKEEEYEVKTRINQKIRYSTDEIIDFFISKNLNFTEEEYYERETDINLIKYEINTKLFLVNFNKKNQSYKSLFIKKIIGEKNYKLFLENEEYYINKEKNKLIKSILNAINKEVNDIYNKEEYEKLLNRKINYIIIDNELDKEYPQFIN